jgi:hypothetical protein
MASISNAFISQVDGLNYDVDPAGTTTPNLILSSGRTLRCDGSLYAPSRHIIAVSWVIPADTSYVVSRYLEISSGITLEIGAGADLEIL